MTRKTPQKKTHGKAAGKRAHGRRPTGKKNAVIQAKEGGYEVGYGKPPVEHQFQPGQSGNPAGPPKARTNLWPNICRFLHMTDKELAEVVKRKDLKLVERTAARIVGQLRDGVPRRGIPSIIKAIIERDEGRPPMFIHLDREEALTPEECEEIRRAMRGQDEKPTTGPATSS